MTRLRRHAMALLIDFDGVLRQWDPAVTTQVEEKYGLKPGALLDTALQWSRLQSAITGRINHAEWMASVAEALAEQAGGRDPARAAVDEWETYRGEIDADVLAFVREVRSAGRRVALATNATDLLDADLARLGLVDEVDVVVNSSVLGVHKPAKEYFHLACQALEVPPEAALVVDDDDRAVRGARVAGLSAYRWNGPADLPYLRAALGLDRS